MKSLKENALVASLFFAFTVFITYPLILKFNSGFYGPFFNTDMRAAVWEKWWWKYASIHNMDWNISPFISAPFGGDLSQHLYFEIPHYIDEFLLRFSDPVFSINLLLFLSFIFTGYFTYLLVRSLTQNKTASLISAFIFTFSPYFLNKTMEFSYNFLGNWIALYVLTLLRLKEKPDLKNMILCGAVFALVLSFNAYYGFFMFIFSLGLLLFCVFPLSKEKIVRVLRLSGALGSVFIIGALLNLPTLIKIAKNMFFAHLTTAEKGLINYVRSFDYLTAQSARPLSYLLPASSHPIFGPFTKKMFGSLFYGRGPIEQTLYLGWVPLILAFVAFRQWKRKRLRPDQYPGYASSRENFIIGFFIFSAWLAFIFSLPPALDLGLFKIYLPSYFTYKFASMFRAYARFGVIVMLSVSVLAGYGLKYLFEKLKTNKARILWASFIFIAIMFEFTNIPPFRVTEITRVPEVYAWIAQQKGDFIIAEYPMAIVGPGEAWENYDYLYYQTIHRKRMANGAQPGTEAFQIKTKIEKVADPMTPRILKDLGVKYIVLHSDAYTKGSRSAGVEVVGEVPRLDTVEGYQLVKKFGDDSIYEVIDVKKN